MLSIPCNLCGADDYRVRFEAGRAQSARIVECRACGLLYANPRTRPPDFVLAREADPDIIEQVCGRIDRATKERLQVRDYARTRAFLARRFPERGALFEVGAGYGYLLDYFRQDGWRVSGIEPNEGLTRFAARTLGIGIEPSILPEMAGDAEPYDVVLLMHVIEHVPDPAETLGAIFRLLRPGGMLVLETPRYDTLMFRLLGRRERSLACEGHIYFFTSRTLREIAARAGFAIEHAEKVGRSLTVDRLAMNLGVVLRSARLGKALRKAARRLGVGDFAMTINLRDMERIYLTRPRHPGRATPAATPHDPGRRGGNTRHAAVDNSGKSA